jgi:hypothetical protein
MRLTKPKHALNVPEKCCKEHELRHTEICTRSIDDRLAFSEKKNTSISSAKLAAIPSSPTTSCCQGRRCGTTRRRG